jgi:hypothetical protein
MSTLRSFTPAKTSALALAGAALIAVTAAAQQPLPAELEPGALALESARGYRERARYPESSRPLVAGEADPVRAARVSAPHTLADPRGEGPAITLWAAQVSFVDPEPVTLHASLSGIDGALAATAVVRGEVLTEAGDAVAKVRYEPDGAVGPAGFTATFELPEPWRPKRAASFLVRVQVELPGGSLHHAAGGFLYSRPGARLTGRFRDLADAGSLVVRAEVEVAQEGRYHLAGTLYSAGGEPLGWAQAARHLPAGRHFIDLRYYGLLFHERSAAGPYRLGALSLADVSSMPNALAPLWEGTYQTRTYPLSAFTTEAFGDPSLLEAASRLEADAASARHGAGLGP